MNTLQTHFWAVRDYLAPVLRESKFKEHGRITPEEFVAAGDFLAYKFPTWAWSAATSSDPKYTRDFLPTDKQYLVSRGVPCLRRVSQMERAALGSSSASSSKGAASKAREVPSDEVVLNFGEGHHGDHVQGKGGEDDWLATHVEDDHGDGAAVGDIADIPDGEASGAALTAGEEDDLAARVASTGIGSQATQDQQQGGIGEIPDMDDEEDDELGGLGAGVEEADDPAAARTTPSKVLLSQSGHDIKNNKLISVRTYDCLITYDKYYQTPRMWLVGYNETGQPLKPAEIFEDVSSDYAQKTVTVEPFPHGSMSTASIHPCKHANVMKKVIERMNASVVEEQRKAIESRRGSGAGAEAAAKKKRGWGLSGAMKKVTGGKEASSPSGAPTDGAISNDEAASGTADDVAVSSEPQGLRVDQYLLVFLKFMASIVPAIEIDATQAM